MDSEPLLLDRHFQGLARIMAISKSCASSTRMSFAGPSFGPQRRLPVCVARGLGQIISICGDTKFKLLPSVEGRGKSSLEGNRKEGFPRKSAGGKSCKETRQHFKRDAKGFRNKDASKPHGVVGSGHATGKPVTTIARA